MSEPALVSEPVELDFEKDLKDVLKKHGFSDPALPRYVIRSLDNYREFWQDYSSQHRMANDSTSNQS